MGDTDEIGNSAPTEKLQDHRNVHYFRKPEVSSNSAFSLYENERSGHTENLGMAMFGIKAQVTSDALIADQKSHKNATKVRLPSLDVPPKPRKKAISQRDVRLAVAGAISLVVRDLEKQRIDFPRWRDAFDYAIAVVQKYAPKDSP